MFGKNSKKNNSTSAKDNGKPVGKKPAGKKPVNGNGKPGQKNSVGKKAAAVRTPQVTPNWLYMNQQEITLAQIGQAVDPVRYPEVHLWAEMGVLEIEVAEKASVDFEAMECDLEDEVGNAFLAENKVKTLVMITIVPAAWEESKALMTEICTKCGGFFCGDTEDFTPVVKVVQIAQEGTSEAVSGANV